MAHYVHIFVHLLFLFFMSEVCSARDSIRITQFLRDPDTLESSNAIFKFGFFSPGNSTYRYAGIWYRNESDGLEVVWVANRQNPLHYFSGVLKIAGDGNLQLFDAENKSIWSTNVTVDSEVNASVAQLLDTGNLVLLSNASGNVIWQSFDHPTESMLPHMKVTFNVNINKSPVFSSWKSPSDPSNGRFTYGLVHHTLSELLIWDGDQPYWRSGPWDGHVFMGIRAMYYFAESDGVHLQYDNESTLSLSFSSVKNKVTEHYLLTYDGMLLQKDWENDTGNWMVLWQSLETDCDVYGKCGEFGSCNSNNLPICSCLRGFEPRNNQEWNAGNWTSGCVRRTPLQCGTTSIRGEEDGFLRLSNMKVPDNAGFVYSYNEEDCLAQCLGNCSCLTYAYSLGFGCMMWTRSLIDIQEFTDVGNDLFIRLAHSELGVQSVNGVRSPLASNMSFGGSRAMWNTSQRRVIISVIVIMSTVAIFVFLYNLWRWINKQHGNAGMNKEVDVQKNMVVAGASDAELQDLSLFKFEDLVVATNSFSERNHLGRGGFGSVYKGKLEDGQEVAVKRLSRASRQGLQEFKNEVVVISKLQHRNLVRLLGCCVEGEEKLLVYEYMPNKSLDVLVFHPSHREHLDWKKRCNIVKGISRGLLYLHRDSRLKIIHRDLKASNILLDEYLNPKISDFGMARIFGGNQDQGDTKRIVGTYGYMSPEYAMEGRFSEKSDVFSFGVLLLEIVSGRRSNSFMDDEDSISLFAHAWKFWNENDIFSFVDPKILSTTFQAEILRFIQLGLLCVQEFPEDRPTISMVVSMIESEDTDLPCPTQPGFAQRRITSSHIHGYASNGASITSLIGR